MVTPNFWFLNLCPVFFGCLWEKCFGNLVASIPDDDYGVNLESDITARVKTQKLADIYESRSWRLHFYFYDLL